MIEKETGVSFPARLYVSIYSAFAPNDWFILSEDGNDTKFSAICRRIVTEQGKQKVVYVLKDNAYEEINHGKLPGKPVQLGMETARDISPSGACVVITDQVAYEVNIQNMEKVGEVKDQFLDGTPPNFVVSDLREKSPNYPGQGRSLYICGHKRRQGVLSNEVSQLFGRTIPDGTLRDRRQRV